MNLESGSFEKSGSPSAASPSSQVDPPRRPGSGGESSPNRGRNGEVESLSKENFNLKLRLYYLEESLQKLRKGDESSETLQEEVMSLRVTLDEKQAELDDRNMLLVRSRTAIESLNTEIDLKKAQLAEARRDTRALEAAKAREAELLVAEKRIAKLESQDAVRMNDILALNNQLREANAALTERQADHHEALMLVNKRDRERDNLEEALRTAVLEGEARGRETLAVQEKLEAAKTELERAQAAGVENASALGRQRAHEAQLIAQAEERQRDLEEKLHNATKHLDELSRERDGAVHAAAVAERRAEDLEERCQALSQEVKIATERGKTIDAERVAVERRAAEQVTALAHEVQVERSSAAKAAGVEVDALRSKNAELQGRVNGLDFRWKSAEEATKAEKERSRDLAAQIEALETQARSDKAAHEEQRCELQSQIESLQQQLETEIKEHAERDELSRRNLALSARRESGLQQELERWESNLHTKLDVLGLPGVNSSTMSSSSSSFRGSEAERLRPHPMFGQSIVVENDRDDEVGNAYHGRPRPRVASLGSVASGGAASVVSVASSSAAIGARLDSLSQLKARFEQQVRANNEKWFGQLKRMAHKLDIYEMRFTALEKELKMSKSSALQLGRQSTKHAAARQTVLEDQLAQARTTANEFERRISMLLADKDALRDKVADLKEGRAGLDGELRIARQELATAQEERRRAEEHLSTTSKDCAVLKENNRVLSLELEDRTKRMEKLDRSKQRALQRVEGLKETLHLKQLAQNQLEERLRQTSKVSKERERALSKTRDRMDRSLQPVQSMQSPVQSPTRDGIEMSIQQQLEDTDRAIRTSNGPSPREKRTFRPNTSGGVDAFSPYAMRSDRPKTMESPMSETYQHIVQRLGRIKRDLEEIPFYGTSNQNF